MKKEKDSKYKTIKGGLHKKCFVCQQYKRLNVANYYKQRSNKDGYQNSCKKCAAEYYKDYWKSQRKRVLAKEQQIIEMYYEQGMCEYEIGKKIGSSATMVETILSKERTRRRRERRKEVTEI